MGRVQFYEIHDQPWFPKLLRDTVTEVLEFALNFANLYQPVVPLLRNALANCGADCVVDLCSGAGGPWLHLQKKFNEDFLKCVYLTDKFPNEHALLQIPSESHSRVKFCREPVDARNVPADLLGFRTIFNSFHHFAPKEAVEILRDAIRTGTGIGVFEIPRRSVVAILFVSLMPLAAFFLVPFVRPFHWTMFVFTYIVPIIPFVLWFDGVVSCLRAYKPAELRKLVAELPDHCDGSDYHWEIGVERNSLWPLPVTFLIGLPPQK